MKIKKGKDVSKRYFDLMNSQRVKEWGSEATPFKKKDFLDANFFFLEKDKRVLAFGMLWPLKVSYLGKGYDILGIKGIFSVEKKKGYGKKIIGAMIEFLEERKKTGVGFCGAKITSFYEKSGLKTEKDFIKRFVYVKENGEKVYDDDGDGIYFEGKDGFVSKVLKGKSPVYIGVEHW